MGMFGSRDFSPEPPPQKKKYTPLNHTGRGESSCLLFHLGCVYIYKCIINICMYIYIYVCILGYNRHHPEGLQFL